MTEPAAPSEDLPASADDAEFRPCFTSTRRIISASSGNWPMAAWSSATHEKLMNYIFTISPRTEKPEGFTLEVWSIGAQVLRTDDAGEELFDLPTMQWIGLGVTPNVAAAIEKARFALWFMVKENERQAWATWCQDKLTDNGDSGWN